MKRIMNGNGNGEWSIVGSDYFKAFERLAAIEDILGDDYDLWGIEPSKFEFCPYCGARMDGDDK